MVSVCLHSDALLKLLPSYLGFSYLGRGVSPPGRRPWQTDAQEAQEMMLNIIIREVKVKITMRYYLISIKMGVWTKSVFRYSVTTGSDII